MDFAKSFGLPWPNCHILFLWVYWPLNQSHLSIHFSRLLRPIFAFFLFLMIPIGFLLHSLGLPWPVCFLWSHFVILWARGFAIRAQWSLLCNFLSSPFHPVFAFFLFLMIPTGFLLHSLGFLGPFAFFGATLLFCGLGVLPFGLNDLYFAIFFLHLFILLGFFCHWALLPKMGINKHKCYANF